MASSSISLTFPDGSVRSFDAGVTGYEVAERISPRLAREALSVTVSGVVRDVNRPITENGHITINTWDTEDGQQTFWHSSAHLLAEATQSLFPHVKFGIGPSISNGFYYDMDFGDYKLTEADLSRIEGRMLELARKKSVFERSEVGKEEAIRFFQEKADPYKLDLIKDLQDGTITFYTQGEFVDLCRGPHIPSTEPIKAIKLLHIAGAYWRGDVKSKQLTRVYGVTFPKKNLLDEYLVQLEEAKKRDHKKLGRELGIYLIDSMVGRGLPLWLPNGTIIRRTLEAFLREEQVRRGYKEVITPHIGNLELYKTSGHYPYYADSQFDPIQVEDEYYMLKPMNCPHHHRIYASQMRSYRDLPLRLAEFGTVYRYEQSGELNGLSRVRGFTQDDAHIYCTHEQLKDEIKSCIDLTRFVFNTFDMSVDIRLSFRDDKQDKYGGDAEFWDRAQAEIKEVADELALDYVIAPGEASFYGPKIDFIIKDALGRKWQVGTIQVDYVMPERFDLTYVGSDNQKHRPVIIHRAPFGSMERFTSILIEHFAGDFPLWLSPVQVMMIPVSEPFTEMAENYAAELRKHGIRVDVDGRNDQIGAKIRDAEKRKVPYMVVLGDKEKADGSVSLRRHRIGNLGSLNFSEFLSKVRTEIESRENPPKSK